MSEFVRNIWSGVSLSTREAMGRTNWLAVVRNSCIPILIIAAVWVYAVLNRYEYLQTREYSQGEYSLLRFDRLRGRLEECVVPGIDGSFRDPTRDEAICLTYRANTTPAERNHE